MIYRAAISLPVRGLQCQSQADVAKILQVVVGPDTAARNCRVLYVRPQHFMQQHAKMFNDLQNV